MTEERICYDCSKLIVQDNRINRDGNFRCRGCYCIWKKEQIKEYAISISNLQYLCKICNCKRGVSTS